MSRFLSTIFSKCNNTIFVLLLMHTYLIGQINQDNPFLSSGIEIVVDVFPENDIFYSHSYRKGISIYNLAEIFQMKADKIFALNHLNSTQPINDGRILKIPLQRDLIISERNKLTKLNKYIPVFYKVKKGETAYRISKNHFGIGNEALLTLNSKKSNDLKTGELLLIGWWPIKDKKFTNNPFFV